MEKKGKILIVDDNEDVLLSLNMLLKPHVEAIRVIKEPERIDELMQSFAPDVIMLDMNFSRDAVSGEEGYMWLAHILRRDPQAVVLFITAYVDTAKVVRAIKAGAVDFIPKPWDKARLLSIVASAVELRMAKSLAPATVEERGSRMESPAPAQNHGGETGRQLIGQSPAMLQLKEQIKIVAPTDANILITGENGTGKDVVAHLIHQYSRRSNRPMATIDLGSIPESLFEGELFGYEKGAFTDARATKAGRIENADGGTLFLDEIGNLTPVMQQKLLTVIEKREISRLGSTRTRAVDIRLVSATNSNLRQRVVDGTFRQDLLYRINTIELHLPPLRQRGEDIILLAGHFARHMAERYGKPVPVLDAEARQCLLSYSWPGNVRELQHTIERAVVLGQAQASAGGQERLALKIELPQDTSTTRSGLEGGLNLAELEHQAIMQAISMHNGNLTLAAETLGISRYTLYRKIGKLER